MADKNKTFLKYLTGYLYKKYDNRLSSICLVFPGKRAAVYFRKYLSDITRGPIWSPSFYTINELLKKISGLQVADNLYLITELYKIFTSEKKSTESFDNFYPWGQVILNDFDEIDKYLVDPVKIFTNISAIKEIDVLFQHYTEEQVKAIKEFWVNFDPGKTSREKEEFLNTWKVLNPVYTKFKEILLSKNWAYEGMLYRKVAEDIKAGDQLPLSFYRYIFVGFNALNQGEKVFFDYLLRNDKADFFWDYDDYYQEKETHEAGRFTRQNIKKYPPPKDFRFNSNNLTRPGKNIKIINAPTDTSQVKIIPKLLGDISRGEPHDYTGTAIILADEKLLVPALHSLPGNVQDINITMGYPLQYTPADSLLKHFLSLQKNKKIQEGQVYFYHEDVISLLNHPYINFIDIQGCEEAKTGIMEKNLVLVPTVFFGDSPLFRKLFCHVKDYKEFSQYLQEALFFVYSHFSSFDNIESESLLDKEFTYQIFTGIRRLEEMLQFLEDDFKKKNIQVSLNTYAKILNKIIRDKSVPFIGEPLKGIQVMGILETRLLDFENVIMLSVNEGILPKAMEGNSLIPYNLRRGFGLPTYEEHDAIFAYYFYRIIQRAHNIQLVYSSKNTGMASGEMSRFLYQLKYEGNYEVKEKNVVFDIKNSIQKDICIENSAEVKNILDTFLQQGYLSPKAINTYLDCSLKFYFRYVAGLQEPRKITGEIDHAVFGVLVHESLKEIYSPYLGKILTPEILKGLLNAENQMEQIVSMVFTREFFKDHQVSELKGRNRIVIEIVKKYLRELVTLDSLMAPIQLVGLEESYKMELPFLFNGQEKSILVGGQVDRIDRVKDTTRIIDYKTGKSKNKIYHISDLFAKENEKRDIAAFQAILYAICFNKKTGGKEKVVPGLYYLRNLFGEKFDYTIKIDKESILDLSIVENDFLELLSGVIKDIFDENINFKRAENKGMCQFCEYKKICHR
ncbi:MAG: PD-(D/E)XK nuclease family protein [Bacteroidota bacterium]